MNASKVRNSLKKGKLFVLHHGVEWEVRDVYKKKVTLVKGDATMTCSVHSIEFSKFKRHGIWQKKKTKTSFLKNLLGLS